MTDYLPPPEQLAGADQGALLRRISYLERTLAGLVIGAVPSTSTSHPANPATGMHILETDTGNELVWNGSTWVPIQTGAWTPYVVAWTSSGTAPGVGSGSLSGRYSKVGRTVTTRISMDGGSGTVFGSGNYSFSLPFTADMTGITSSDFAHAGIWVLQNSGSAYYTAGAFIGGTTPTVVQGVVSGTANLFGATAPATWNANSSFVCTITYESTS